MSAIQEFNDYRSRMNDRIMGSRQQGHQSFFGVWIIKYTSRKCWIRGQRRCWTRGFHGLFATTALSIIWHCHEEGLSIEEIFEILSVAIIVGGSICIPHTRRAVEFWDRLLNAK